MLSVAVVMLVTQPLDAAVHPPAVVLAGPRDGRQLVITGRFADGTDRDLSAVAAVTPDRPNVVTVEPGAYVRPAGGGSATLTVAAGGRTVRVPVTAATAGPPVSFRRDVIPALNVGGCNMGACHGTPSGKNGFRLSLRGENPATDFRHLTRDLGGRRGTADPAASVLLLKGLGQLPHEGGVRLPASSLPAEAIADWLRAGTPDDPPGLPPVKSLTVTPAVRNLVAPADPAQQLAVVATFADGSTRDVTRLSVFTTSDLSVADATLTGRVWFKRPGETAVLVRYQEQMASVRLAYLKPAPGFVWPDPPARTPLDAAAFAKLKTLGIAPAGLCTDSQFVRRAFLDSTGRLPTAAETTAFLAAPDRDALIDSLLGRPEFADWWAMKWADVLRVSRATLGAKGANGFHLWLRDRFAAGTPLDALARELLTAGGDTAVHPAAGFWRTAKEPQARAEAVAQLFLGARIGCAKCHNHPFERWTQDDYHSLAAVFGRVRTRAVPGSGARTNVAGANEVVAVVRKGEVVQPRTGKTLRPDVPGGGLPDVPPGADRRAVFADWLTASPQFARALANRVWFHLVGRGVVDPVDDLRDSNPASNDVLLDALTAELVAGKFDLRHLVRQVMRSRVYQLAADPTAGDDTRYFGSATVKLLTAEQLLDAVGDVTGVPERFAGLPPGTRAVQLADGDTGHPFLKAFGRPARELPCECERTSDGTMPQALHLLNGPTVGDKLRVPDNRLGRRLAAGASDDAILDELYLRAVSRRPTAEERRLALGHVAAGDRRAGWEDVLWAVLNSREFLFRH
jgi:hypothetical protein